MAVSSQEPSCESQTDRYPLLMERPENYENHEHIVDIVSASDASSSSSSDEDSAHVSNPTHHENRPLTDAWVPISPSSPSSSDVSESRNSSIITRAHGPGRRRWSPFNSGLWISIEIVFTTSLIVASIVVLSLSRDEKPQTPLFAWVVGYAAVPSMDNSVAPMVITDDGLQETAISSKTNPSKGRWRAAIFIIFVEMAERFAYYGVAGNLFTYLTNVLGEHTATAAKNVNTWVGVSAIFPLLGGFIADSYLGRFKTIIASSVIYLAGLLLMTLSVSVQSLRHHRAVFFTALYILSIGEGGHKPCVQTFAADQFDEDTVEEKKDKSSFFNWWYVGIVVGSTTAILVVIYVQDNVGWGLGFGMLAAAVAAALLLFLIGIRSYRRQRPVGSPLTRVMQVLVATARKLRVNETRYGRGVCLEDEGDDGVEEGGRRGRSLAPTNQFRFLDKATIIDDIDASTKVRNHWRLCPATQVEEVKLLFSLFPIWLSCLTFATVIAQMSTYFTKQGSTLERSIGSHFSIPPASLQVCTGLTILVSVGLYDRVLVPVARKFTGLPSGITMLQRIGTGIFFSMLTMVVAALVETKRISVAIDHGLTDSPRTTLPMKIWWLLPQYMLTGMCDVFTIVGMQELFYDQMPEEMRSIGAALYISTVGVGSLMSSAAISIVQAITSRAGGKWLGDNLNRAHLNYFYSVLAGCSALNLIVYIWVAKRFVYKKTGYDDPKGEQKKAAELA